MSGDQLNTVPHVMFADLAEVNIAAAHALIVLDEPLTDLSCASVITFDAYFQVPSLALLSGKVFSTLFWMVPGRVDTYASW